MAANTQIADTNLGPGDSSVGVALRRAFAELDYASYPIAGLLFSALFGLIAAYRSFGFDVVDGGVLTAYPYVADGWGLWYWLASTGISFYFFFFIVNAALAALLFKLAFPRGFRGSSTSASLLLLAYTMLWFLFGQSRYGMALAILAPAAISGSIPIFILCGALAILIHKAAAGGVLILFVWRFLRNRKYGLYIAAIGSIICSLLVNIIAERFLVMLGYGAYLNWLKLPKANTPLKFYWMIGVLVLWKILERRTSNSVLILTLLMLPFSYFIVFAGRTFEIYAVLLLFSLIIMPSPRYVKILIFIPIVADLFALLFYSGFYF